MFARASCAAKASPTTMDQVIEQMNKPRVQHPLGLTLNSICAVRALAFPRDGARLAQAVSDNVVASDATTEFTLLTFKCGSEVWSIAVKDKMMAAGCRNTQFKIFRLNESLKIGRGFNLNHP